MPLFGLLFVQGNQQKERIQICGFPYVSYEAKPLRFACSCRDQSWLGLLKHSGHLAGAQPASYLSLGLHLLSLSELCERSLSICSADLQGLLFNTLEGCPNKRVPCFPKARGDLACRYSQIPSLKANRLAKCQLAQKTAWFKRSDAPCHFGSQKVQNARTSLTGTSAVVQGTSVARGFDVR